MSLVHIWAYCGTPSPNDQRRMDLAQATWGQFGENRRVLFDCGSPEAMRAAKEAGCGPDLWQRNSIQIGDKHPAWYVRDIIDEGIKVLKRRDSIVLSNADIYFMPDAAEKLTEAIREYGCCWSRRHDFNNLPIEPIYTIKDGAENPGTDVFGFDMRWARDFLPGFPQMVFGRQHWDCCMRLLMRKTGGVHVPDIAAHEVHASQWLSGECNRANLYNEKLLCQWIALNGGSEQDHLYTNEEIGWL